MPEKFYTIGEIFRLGLLKTPDGTPYRHKANVMRIVKQSGMAVDRPTKFGPSRTLTRRQIQAINATTKKPR